jgi:small-conductance mechanosensitive channel
MAAPAEDLGALLASLQRTDALIELAVLMACLGLAWLAVRLLRGNAARPASIWFGDRIVDGVLFPTLALAFALAARWLLARSGYVEALAVFRLAVPILASLLMIRVAVRVLRVAFPQSHAVRVLERTLSWLVWIALVLWVTGLLPLLLEELEAVKWKLGGADVSLRSLLEGVLSAGVVLVLALWISAAIESRLLAGATGSLSVRKIAANGVRALLLLVGLLLALSAAGIPLGALGVLGGAVGVGIGFGLQKLAANYVSGFVILAERSMRIGDNVRVDNFEGRITDINARYTVIRSTTGRESIVPNELLIINRVENLSLADDRLWQSTVVSVAYDSDVEQVTRLLLEAAVVHDRVLKDPAPSVALSNFGADGLEFTLGYWIADPENGTLNIRSLINRSILQALRAHGIEIPYPQRVLHMRPAQAQEAAEGGPASTGHEPR